MMMGTTFKIMGAYTDHIIKPLLLELSQEGEVTYSKVAEELNMPYATVKHSVTRMLEKGEITREGGGRRWGYKYRELKS